GIRMEDKGPAFAIHYRGAAAHEIQIAQEAVIAAVGSCADLRVMQGKKVWEILPWAIGDKGAAALRKLNAMPKRVLPFYLGDDRTDEPAFAALSHGITVLVGARSLSHAKYRLRNPVEVRFFLERLAAVLR